MAKPDFAVQPVHRKLVYPRPPPVLRDYANLYRFGEPAEPAPLLVYVGGQISIETHADRFRGTPIAVVDELKVALQGAPVARLDFLVMPSPPCRRPGFEDHGEDFLDLFENSVLPDLGPNPPSGIAFVALSYGASLATYLACSLENAKALIIFGGVGVDTAAKMAMPVVPKGMVVEIHRNDSDKVADPVSVVAGLPKELRARAVRAGPGGHDFVDYAANGTVAGAFRTGLKAIMAARTLE